MFTSDVYALQVTCGAAEFNAQVNGIGRKMGHILKFWSTLQAVRVPKSALTVCPWCRTALDSGRLPASGGEKRTMRIAASLAAGHPVSLRDAIPGLDHRNTSLVIKAVLHAAGQIKARASEP
jgi:hypothetical protein